MAGPKTNRTDSEHPRSPTPREKVRKREDRATETSDGPIADQPVTRD